MERPDSLPPVNFNPEEEGAPSGELTRLLVVPIFVTVLLAGGVYWVRQMPAGAMASNPSYSIVQVRLLPRPDPTPIAVERAETAALSTNSQQLAQNERPESPAVDYSRQPTRERTLASLEPNIAAAAKTVPASKSNPPSSIALKFQQNLFRHIERFQHYPAAARSARLEGTAQVLFVMRRDGTVLNAWIKTSAGQMMLDTEAIETIRRAAPLPPIPDELPERLNIMLPVAFALPR